MAKELWKDQNLKIEARLIPYGSADGTYRVSIQYNLIRSIKERKTSISRISGSEPIIDKIEEPFSADSEIELPKDYLIGKMHDRLDQLRYRYNLGESRLVIPKN